MKDYSELKMLAEKATPGEWAHEQDNLYFYEDGYTRHMMELNEGSDIGYVEQKHNSDFIAAANPDVILELIAEVDSLRDDLEQVKYETNAWRNSEESVWVEVFYSEGDEPFISSVSGQITIEQLSLIQSEMIEYSEDYFEKGSGLYVFRCSHCQAYYDNVGMTEPAHWETDLESYSEFPWQSDGESVVSEDNQ